MSFLSAGDESEVLVLRIVRGAGLKPPFGPRAKVAVLGRSASIDGEPSHLLTQPVYRDVLTRSTCESCGTWYAGIFLRQGATPECAESVSRKGEARRYR